MRCLNCNEPMNMTHLTFIEECPTCGNCYDLLHGIEVKREWVYPLDVPQSVAHAELDDGWDGLRLCSVCRQYECQSPATKCWRCREQEMIDKFG